MSLTCPSLVLPLATFVLQMSSTCHLCPLLVLHLSSSYSLHFVFHFVLYFILHLSSTCPLPILHLSCTSTLIGPICPPFVLHFILHFVLQMSSTLSSKLLACGASWPPLSSTSVRHWQPELGTVHQSRSVTDHIKIIFVVCQRAVKWIEAMTNMMRDRLPFANLPVSVCRHEKCPKFYPSRIVHFKILTKSAWITSISKSRQNSVI